MLIRVVMDDVVETDDGQLDLWFEEIGDTIEDEGDIEDTFVGQVNGLVGAAHPGRVYLNLARRSGGSPVRIETHDEEPPLTDDWEDIVEVSTVVRDDGDCAWTSWAGENGGGFEVPSGPHRLRVSARGRDAGADEDNEDAEESVDSYLVQAWPPLRFSRTPSSQWSARTRRNGTKSGARTADRCQRYHQPRESSEKLLGAI